MVVILHNIRSLHNVGSMFRTADGAGIEKMYLTGYTGIPPRKEIAKTALGAEESVDWEYVKRPLDLIRRLQKEGITVVALERSKKSVDYMRMKLTRPIALLVGNEVRGLSPQLLKHVDHTIDIPMRGIKESLNVSVAFGVAAYSLTSKIK